MKKSIFSLVVMFFIVGTISVFAQSKTEEFKVYGNCGMCENRIENAAKSVDGVTTAEWNKKTKMLKVSYDKYKADNNKIQKAIAKVGHDTDMHKADDKVYNALPGCCKYERKAVDDHKKK
ncbi:MAG: heavy-metal-associated domain-containing protein [Bacteroidetes bacterium]|nr:heavy-metal-associated domain-containing protein [Bacteroidota bacterium]